MRLLKETAKRMIELCDGSLQGMASTMNLLTYYNDIFGGALKHELEMLNGMMASKLCEAKNDVKGLENQEDRGLSVCHEVHIYI